MKFLRRRFHGKSGAARVADKVEIANHVMKIS
jgi:hypothetical protein